MLSGGNRTPSLTSKVRHFSHSTNSTYIVSPGNMGVWVRDLSNDGQLRWVGPEKGVLHLATAAIVNAFWDLWGKMEKKPVWKLLADMTPDQIVSLIDFR